jgi:heme exporter protein A
LNPDDGIILVCGLKKRLGRREALRGIDMQVDRGQIAALVGPNGAGKTTLLRILSTLMRPDAGDVEVNHFNLPAQADGARKSLGAVFHHPMVYGDLNVSENMRFHARMHLINNPESRIEQLLEEFGLDPGRTEPVRTYSRGMLQRLALAKALLPLPNVLLLDEPFTGLDAQAGDALNRLLLRSAEHGCTVLLSGHDLAVLEKTASQFILMTEGRVVSSFERDTLPADGLTGVYQRAMNGANNRTAE